MDALCPPLSALRSLPSALCPPLSALCPQLSALRERGFECVEVFRPFLAAARRIVGAGGGEVVGGEPEEGADGGEGLGGVGEEGLGLEDEALVGRVVAALEIEGLSGVRASGL